MSDQKRGGDRGDGAMTGESVSGDLQREGGEDRQEDGDRTRRTAGKLGRCRINRSTDELESLRRDDDRFGRCAESDVQQRTDAAEKEKDRAVANESGFLSIEEMHVDS